MTNITRWTRQRERGSAALLRFMVWLSLKASRGLGDLLLYPISGWFLLTSPRARAASRQYLAKVLDRPAGFADVARHILTFARVIMDGVFFLTNHLDRYRIETEGLEHVASHVEAGRGCILLGAHLGSFEAMRALGRQAPVRVRPVVFRGNAGAPTQVLEALAPDLAAAAIDLGHPDAMLAVAESLGEGEIVAFLADRATDLKRLAAVPFLGAPALFPTGPFQIAAITGAPAVMFLGLRTGRRRYLLRFEPLTAPGAAPAPREMIAAFAVRLEAACRRWPYQWFNFYDFWEAAARDEAASGSVRRQEGRNSLSAAAMLLLCALPSAAPAGDLVSSVMADLARGPAGEASFREEKTLPNLTRPLVSMGTLSFRRPDHLEKRTKTPIQEDLIIDGGQIVVSGDEGGERRIDLDAHPALRAMAATFLGVLTGDLTALRQRFDIDSEGTPAAWRLMLRPRDPAAAALIEQAVVSGGPAGIREIRLLQPKGHWDVMTILEP